MIRLELDQQRGEFTIIVDDKGADNLRSAAEDAKRGNKVLLGDPGAMLIVKHSDWRPSE